MRRVVWILALAAGCAQAPELLLCHDDWDRGADGTIDRSQDYLYDEHGNVASIDEDSNGDGEIDRTIVYQHTLDAEGRPTRTEIVYRDDYHEVHVYAYDDAGNVTHHEFQAGAGANAVTDFTYDEGGRVLTEAWDYEDDGVVDRTYTYSYTVEEVSKKESRVTRRDADTTGDGVFDQYTAYSYDEAGDLTLESTHDTATDALISTVTRAWDDEGRQTRVATDANGDGSAERVLAWTYADGPDPVTLREDIDGDGTFDNETSYEWAEVCGAEAG